MIPFKSCLQTAVPETLEVRQEIMKAIHTLLDDQSGVVQRRRRDVTDTHFDPDALAQSICEAARECARAMVAEIRKLRKYSPNQPRVPAGSPDGGQWTKEDGNASATSIAGRLMHESSLRSATRYAMLESSSDGTQTDAPTPGLRYAAGAEEDEERWGERRINGLETDATPGQEVRLEVARANYERLSRRVLRIDPAWKPTPMMYESTEGEIGALQDAAKEAAKYLAQLRELGFPRDPRTGELVPQPAGKIGNPFIDYTTDKLMDILNEVMDRVGPRANRDPEAYGTLVHTEFAKAVRAAGLRGIESDDVERTFGVEPNAPYGARYSIRTDLILRGDDGEILAIYDLKTGGGLPRFRVVRIRFMTKSDATVPLIELNRDRGPLWKRRRA